MGCYLTGAAANFCLNLYLIPLFGIKGAAMATASSLVFVSTLYLLFAHHISKLQPFRLNHLKPVFSAFVAVFIVYAITKYLIGVSFFSLVVMFFVFLLIYFFMLLFIKGFDENDLMIMRAIDERLGTKSDWIRKIIQRFL